MLNNEEYTAILKENGLDHLITNQWITIDRTAPDGCHCVSELDDCGEGCINTEKGGQSC